MSTKYDETIDLTAEPTKIYVENVHKSDYEDAEYVLKELFEQYGSVSKCEIVDNHAIVCMNNDEEAIQAVAGLDGSRFTEQKTMRVDFTENSQPEKKRDHMDNAKKYSKSQIKFPVKPRIEVIDDDSNEVENGSTNVPFTAEININEVLPNSCRRMLGDYATITEVTKSSGAKVSCQGKLIRNKDKEKFNKKNKYDNLGVKPLYLLIEGETLDSVNAAVTQFKDLLLQNSTLTLRETAKSRSTSLKFTTIGTTLGKLEKERELMPPPAMPIGIQRAQVSSSPQHNSGQLNQKSGPPTPPHMLMSNMSHKQQHNIDSNLTLQETTKGRSTNLGKFEKERELMPPPPIPIGSQRAHVSSSPQHNSGQLNQKSGPPTPPHMIMPNMSNKQQHNIDSNDFVTAEVDINEVLPNACRRLLADYATTKEISNTSGASVSCQGMLIRSQEKLKMKAAHRRNDFSKKPLHLVIEGNPECVHVAIIKTQDILHANSTLTLKETKTSTPSRMQLITFGKTLGQLQKIKKKAEAVKPQVPPHVLLNKAMKEQTNKANSLSSSNIRENKPRQTKPESTSQSSILSLFSGPVKKTVEKENPRFSTHKKSSTEVEIEVKDLLEEEHDMLINEFTLSVVSNLTGAAVKPIKNQSYNSNQPLTLNIKARNEDIIQKAIGRIQSVITNASRVEEIKKTVTGKKPKKSKPTQKPKTPNTRGLPSSSLIIPLMSKEISPATHNMGPPMPDMMSSGSQMVPPGMMSPMPEMVLQGMMPPMPQIAPPFLRPSMQQQKAPHPKPTKNTKFNVKIYLRLDDAPIRFNVKARVLGDTGTNLTWIENETGAIVTLQGIGSGTINPDTGKEHDEPLNIQVMHFYGVDMGIKAESLTQSLINQVQAQFADFETKKDVQSSVNLPGHSVTSSSKSKATFRTEAKPPRTEAKPIRAEAKPIRNEAKPIRAGAKTTTRLTLSLKNLPYDTSIGDILELLMPSNPVFVEMDRLKTSGTVYADFSSAKEVKHAHQLLLKCKPVLRGRNIVHKPEKILQPTLEELTDPMSTVSYSDTAEIITSKEITRKRISTDTSGPTENKQQCLINKNQDNKPVPIVGSYESPYKSNAGKAREGSNDFIDPYGRRIESSKGQNMDQLQDRRFPDPYERNIMPGNLDNRDQLQGKPLDPNRENLLSGNMASRNIDQLNRGNIEDKTLFDPYSRNIQPNIQERSKYLLNDRNLVPMDTYREQSVSENRSNRNMDNFVAMDTYREQSVSENRSSRNMDQEDNVGANAFLEKAFLLSNNKTNVNRDVPNLNLNTVMDPYRVDIAPEEVSEGPSGGQTELNLMALGSLKQTLEDATSKIQLLNSQQVRYQDDRMQLPQETITNIRDQMLQMSEHQTNLEMPHESRISQEMPNNQLVAMQEHQRDPNIVSSNMAQMSMLASRQASLKNEFQDLLGQLVHTLANQSDDDDDNDDDYED